MARKISCGQTHKTESMIPSRLKPGGDNEWIRVVSSVVSAVQPLRSVD